MSLAFNLATPDVAPTFAFTAAPAPKALTDKHRPRSLADMVGQGAAVYQLQSFLEVPYSVAFLFEGETGIGKTTAALALAFDLGCDLEWAVHHIKSGEQDAEAVEAALRSLRFSAPGSGWKVVIVDEADHMSVKAANLWLSALEDLPPRSVIVFTTNYASKFPQRFVDRCEVIPFTSEAATLMQDAQTLINDIWTKEGAPGDAPRADDLPGLVDAKGKISFRRAVRLLEPMIRRAKAGDAPAPKAEPKPKAAPKAKAEPKPDPKPEPAPKAARAPKPADLIDWRVYADRWNRNPEDTLAGFSRETGIPVGTIIGRLERAGVVFPKRGEKRTFIKD